MGWGVKFVCEGVRANLSHEGVKLVKEVVALMKECELCSHVGQELCVCVCVCVCLCVSTHLLEVNNYCSISANN